MKTWKERLRENMMTNSQRTRLAKQPKTRRLKLASIATRTANKMSRKTSWCQGTWARFNGRRGGSHGAAEQADQKVFAADSNRHNVPYHYMEANSPKAVKFCVEGAIYNAAGKVFSRIVPGYNAARDVIALLDAEVTKNEGGHFRRAQQLNDSNGDESRKKLVKHLRTVARELRA